MKKALAYLIIFPMGTMLFILFVPCILAAFILAIPSYAMNWAFEVINK